jgi:HEAT repeat protein
MDERSDTIGGLIRALNQTDKKAVRAAVDELVAMAKSAPQVADRLNALIATTAEEERWPIAYVLAEIAPPTTPCLEALEDALGLDDPDVRWAVALLLVRLAKQSASGIAERLAALVKSGRATQRRMAVYCLRDIDAEAAPRALSEALRDNEPLVRVAAITSLKAFPKTGGAALGQLIQLVFNDPDSRVRASAALALARIEPTTKEIHAALEDAARSADQILAKAGRAALEILKQR